MILLTLNNKAQEFCTLNAYKAALLAGSQGLRYGEFLTEACLGINRKLTTQEEWRIAKINDILFYEPLGPAKVLHGRPHHEQVKLVTNAFVEGS